MDASLGLRSHASRLWPFLLAILPFSGCQCEDTVTSQQWRFGFDTGFDAVVDTDSPPDTQPPPPDTSPPPLDTLTPPDTTDVSVDAWQPENVVSDVKCSEALDDRTSVIVDARGTTWVAFHKYRSDNCNRRPTLVVARKPLGGNWTEEDIQPHSYIFRLSSIRPGNPKLVYADPVRRRGGSNATGTFRVASRKGRRNWNIRELPVGNRVTGSPGFDVDEDGDSFWVTFTHDQSDDVQLFEFDTTRTTPDWQSRTTLRVENPHAALARGLQTGPRDSVYLVHRNGARTNSPYGVARYDKGVDAWPARDYFDRAPDDTIVHSLELRNNGEICMSSVVPQRRPSSIGTLLVTCGTMSDLEQRTKRFPNRSIPTVPPSSIIEGDDGTLYVAFHPPNKSELRLATREPGSSWSVQTIYSDQASAVSTAIDRTGDLVLAFYTETDDGRTALKVLRERPDQL